MFSKLWVILAFCIFQFDDKTVNYPPGFFKFFLSLCPNHKNGCAGYRGYTKRCGGRYTEREK